jgi:hypothetical protein
MIDRFKGWPMQRIAATACLECQVGYDTCYKVLFKGKPIASPATQRVATWARTNSVRIVAPKAKEAPVNAAASLEEAERWVAEQDR